MITRSELQSRSPEELDAMVGEKRARLDELRFLLAQNKIKNVKESAAVRKSIAQILTMKHSLIPRL